MRRPRLDSSLAPLAILGLCLLIVYVVVAGIREQKLRRAPKPHELRISFGQRWGEPWSVLFETDLDSRAVELKSGTFQWNEFPGKLHGTIEVVDEKKVAFQLTVDLQTSEPIRLLLAVDNLPTVTLQCDGKGIDIETNLSAGRHAIVIKHPAAEAAAGAAHYRSCFTRANISASGSPL